MSVCELSELKVIPQGRILGIDYGDKRIGLAMSDPSQFLASTLTTLQNDGQVEVNIAKIISENGIQLVVMGKPLHMDGRIGKSFEKAKQLAEKLDVKCSIPVVMWDERWTSVSAHKLMHETGKKPSKEKAKVDQLAAAFLLQSFLDRIANIRH